MKEGKTLHTSHQQVIFGSVGTSWALHFLQCTREVKNLFSTMDASGDGVINFGEFSKLVQSPMLQFLLSQLLGLQEILVAFVNHDLYACSQGQGH